MTGCPDGVVNHLRTSIGRVELDNVASSDALVTLIAGKASLPPV